MSRVIYQQFRGSFVKINEPRNAKLANFLIRWQGKDWSGFRTLEECRRQFKSLEARPNACEDNFQVVET